MLQGESTNGGCSMEQAKGMREFSEGCVAFLGMVPRGRLCKMWHVNKDFKEVKMLSWKDFPSMPGIPEDFKKPSVAEEIWTKRRADKNRGSLGKRDHGGPQKPCARTAFHLNSGWTSLSFTSQHKSMRTECYQSVQYHWSNAQYAGKALRNKEEKQ